MASLPSNGRMAAGNGVITPENPLNSPGVSNNQGYNTFDLSRQNCVTQRFGEITPFDVQEAEVGDRFSLKLSHESRAYTFKSPIMSNVRLNKDYFFVPYSAIMPRTYEQLFVNPVKGSDVPDDAYPVFDLGTYISNLVNILGSSPSAPNTNSYYKLPVLSLLWHTLQYGSLLDNLGYRSHLLYDYDASSNIVTTFSDFFDTFINGLRKNGRKLTISSKTIGGFAPFSIDYSTDPSAKESRDFWFRFFNMAEPWYVSSSNIEDGDFTELYNSLSTYSASFKKLSPINIRRLVAYQLTCAQFYTNDAVDNIYTGKLWIQNMESLAHYTGSGYYPLFFDFNGIQLQYDVFSRKVTDKLISYFSGTVLSLMDFSKNTVDANVYYMLFFFQNLFSYENALVYGDYFAGARTQPLAVGDVDIQVSSSNTVSAIDVTRNIMMQRFLNAVNRVGQLVADYSRNVFGFAPKNLPPQPRFIVHQANTLMGNEVPNTSSTEQQGNLVTNLRSNSSKYMYDVFIDEQGILLGVASMTCSTVYLTTTSRHIFHYNRMDDFQPFLQNIGDQPIYSQEIAGISSDSGIQPIGSRVFGYQIQDAEYKYAVSEAHGGFVKALRSWIFARKFTLAELNSMTISPEFLRFRTTDFDDFYSSLNGQTLEDYFHLVTSFNLGTKANRKMMFRPGIL